MYVVRSSGVPLLQETELTKNEADLTRAEETIRRVQQQIQETRQRVSPACGDFSFLCEMFVDGR